MLYWGGGGEFKINPLIHFFKAIKLKAINLSALIKKEHVRML